MAKLTAHKREGLPKSDFALPGKGEGPKGAGSGSYPIPDESHARNALARSSGKPVHAEVERKVHAKYPDIGRASGGSVLTPRGAATMAMLHKRHGKEC